MEECVSILPSRRRLPLTPRSNRQKLRQKLFFAAQDARQQENAVRRSGIRHTLENGGQPLHQQFGIAADRVRDQQCEKVQGILPDRLGNRPFQLGKALVQKLIDLAMVRYEE